MLKPWHKQMANLDGLDLPHVSQIGMVVPDLLKGVRFYRDFLGIQKWYQTVITECSYYYRNRPIDIRLDIAVGYSGKTQIELIEVHGKDDNIYQAHPGEAGFGFHHFGVVVNDLRDSVRTMRGRGFAPLQEGMLKYAGGGKTKVAYLDTMDKAGLILELIETKAFGINLGMPEWLINLGRITGDTKAIHALKE
jgi:catechol 2,3-dioxygenase-like lactoylglutathione lyase family enzyme